jgi:hypothetical protein
MGFILDVGYSLLPKRRWGDRSSSPTAASISGVLQAASCAGLLIYRYEHFFYSRAQQLIRLSQGAVSDANAGTQLYFASAITVEYLFLQPLSLLLLYLALEGLVRAAAAFLTEEILPTLPFKVIDSIARRLQMGNAGKEAEEG